MFNSPFLRTTVAALSWVAVCAFTPNLGWAKEDKEAPSKSSAQATGLSVTKSFSEMGLGVEPIRLPTWKATYLLKLPLSPRERLKSAQLTLETVNSTALIRSRSALTVRLNGTVLKQTNLDAVNTRQTQKLELPAKLLKNGYNNLEFEAVQHYTYECEDPASPELWTEINPRSSYLELDFEGLNLNVQPRLSQLDVAFDKRAWMDRPVAFVTGTEHISETQLAAASMVAQGIALRKGYGLPRMSLLSASTAASVAPGGGEFPGLVPWVAQGQDVVLVGRRAEISRYMSSMAYQHSGASGPFVGTYAADNGRSLVLLVTGNTNEEVLTAARSVASMAYRFQDAPYEYLKSVSLEKPYLMTPGNITALSKLGHQTRSVRSLKPDGFYIEFSAPAEYAAKKGDLAEMRLHFSYGAGLRNDSSLVVRLNGNFAVAVPLNEPSGNEFTRYELSLPAQFIRPGINALQFEPVFIANRGKCETPREEGLVLTLYEDSTLELPRPTQAPVVPDLQRFALSRWPVHDKFQVHLTERTTEAAGAAMVATAALAQHVRAPVEVLVSYDRPTTGHILAVGSTASMQDAYGALLTTNAGAWSAEGNHVAMVQGLQESQIVTTLFAARPQLVQDGVRLLSELNLWSEVKGAAAVIDVQEKTIRTTMPTETSNVSNISELTVWFGSWKTIAAAAAVLALLFSVAFIYALREAARKRIADSKEHDDESE